MGFGPLLGSHPALQGYGASGRSEMEIRQSPRKHDLQLPPLIEQHRDLMQPSNSSTQRSPLDFDSLKTAIEPLTRRGKKLGLVVAFHYVLSTELSKSSTKNAPVGTSFYDQTYDKRHTASMSNVVILF